MMRKFFSYIVLFWSSFNAIIIIVDASSSTVTPAAKLEAKLLGRNADPLVAAAPLVIGSTCQDGCVLMAVHTTFAQEPLLMDIIGEEEVESKGLQDLPRDYRGPFRVFSVDSHGTLVACAGWRSDGQTLVNYCQALAKKEVSLYGRPVADSQYGNYLATEASLWLARSAVLGKMRPLSCAGLLASCPGGNSPGNLWLVDITGSYPIRAHAIGGGPLAGIVNDYLTTLDFATMKHDQVIKLITEFLSELDGIPKGSRIEVVSAGQKGGKRHLLSSILN